MRRISVYRLYYHTETHDEEGKELRRTSPENQVVAAEDPVQAVQSLPNLPEGTKYVVDQAAVLYGNIAFGPDTPPLPQAKHIPPPAPPPETPAPEQPSEEPKGRGFLHRK